MVQEDRTRSVVFLLSRLRDRDFALRRACNAGHQEVFRYRRICRMKRLAALASFAVLYLLIGALNLPAQDLVITNARIIVGNGTVIDRGSIVIREGRLTSVAADAAANA